MQTRREPGKKLFVFVCSKFLGHAVHGQNLQSFADRDSEIESRWIWIDPREKDFWSKLYFVKTNYTALLSLRAWSRLRRLQKELHPSVVFFHTQENSLLSLLFLSVPAVLSLDATPKNMDAVGEVYGHYPSRFAIVEDLKSAIYRWAFRKARHLITWNHWAKESLIKDYEVDPEKISVFHCGVDLSHWPSPSRKTSPKSRLTRILFVGGDFERKGGPLLLKIFKENFQDTCGLDLVTKSAVREEGIANLKVHRGVRPNSRELKRLYEEADIFAMPSLADIGPIVYAEAMAMKLPVVGTRSAAAGEIVVEGKTGRLIPPNDEEALIEAIRSLVRDPQLRLEMGEAGRARVEKLFDAAKNDVAVIGILKSVSRDE